MTTSKLQNIVLEPLNSDNVAAASFARHYHCCKQLSSSGLRLSTFRLRWNSQGLKLNDSGLPLIIAFVVVSTSLHDADRVVSCSQSAGQQPIQTLDSESHQ
jgi:hypothetical protein